MASVEIYIPTLGRTVQSKQESLNEFLTKSKYRPWLVCPLSEVSQHKSYYDRIIGCSKNGTENMGAVRQWIMENSKADIIIQVDDDMKFQYRPDRSITKLKQCKNLNPMIQRCINSIEAGFIYGGVSARQGNNHIKENHRDCQRNSNFHFLNRKKVLETKTSWDILPVMEDFYFALSLLTKGYPNRILFDYCWNQRPGSVGGCNEFRTMEVQRDAALELKRLFPDFVTVVKKYSKTGWSIAKGERYDVRIQWKKAYLSSQK